MFKTFRAKIPSLIQPAHAYRSHPDAYSSSNQTIRHQEICAISGTISVEAIMFAQSHSALEGPKFGMKKEKNF